MMSHLTIIHIIIRLLHQLVDIIYIMDRLQDHARACSQLIRLILCLIPVIDPQ